ncbi:MAG: hypothetical protein AB7J28_16320 [Hyphomonadaceae bacterium]
MTRKLNTTLALSVSAMAASFAFFAAPAHATNGQEAIDACNRHPTCFVQEDDSGGILINVDDSWVFCYDRETDCVVVVRETGPARPLAETLRPDVVAGADAGNPPARPTHDIVNPSETDGDQTGVTEYQYTPGALNGANASYTNRGIRPRTPRRPAARAQ